MTVGPGYNTNIVVHIKDFIRNHEKKNPMHLLEKKLWAFVKSQLA
jgi:hypothetical protein